MLVALQRLAPVTSIRGNVDTGSWAGDYADTELVGSQSVSGQSHQAEIKERRCGARRFKLSITLATLYIGLRELRPIIHDLGES